MAEQRTEGNRYGEVLNRIVRQWIGKEQRYYDVYSKGRAWKGIVQPSNRKADKRKERPWKGETKLGMEEL